MASGTAPLATYDPLASVYALTDITAIDFVAAQLNNGTLNQNIGLGSPTCRDLTDAIVDIIIGTAAQGASTLEVHITDPYWQLLSRYGDRPAFIDVDDSGLLIPVDVNFPQGTDGWWRLQAAEPSIDMTEANLVLTFEDRIVVLVRDQGGPVTAGNNQTRAEFIAQLVKTVPSIRFVCPALTEPAGSVGGDITQGQLAQLGNPTTAASATASDAPTARRNPTKKAGIGRSGRQNGGTKSTGAGAEAGASSPSTITLLNPGAEAGASAT